eukprot:248695-Prymnesium_polylepis.1
MPRGRPSGGAPSARRRPVPSRRRARRRECLGPCGGTRRSPWRSSPRRASRRGRASAAAG